MLKHIAWLQKVYRGRSIMSDRKNMKLFALNSNQEIAQKIAQAVGVPLGKLSSRQFSDGEIQVNIEESVRGYDVYIIQSTSSLRGQPSYCHQQAYRRHCPRRQDRGFALE